MIKAVTLKDIARETGVHVSTVSRALDPKARHALTDEVVKRVQRAAERMGYRPNRLASGLRTNRTMTVGLMLPDITNTLFPPIVRGVESVLEPLGYASIIVNTDGAPDREARLIDILLERGVDGIVHAAALRDDPSIVSAARGVPVVTVNRQTETGGIPSVVNDDADGIRLALEHLHARGHRRIAHIAGPLTLSTGLVRRDAFLTVAARLGIETPPGAVFQANYYDEAEGRRCTEALLAGTLPFTAILCANDRLALGALEVLGRHGIDCPGEMSVTGFNDIPFLDLIPPGLTTVRVMQFDVGALAATRLVSLMTGPAAEVPMSTVLPVSLVERGSVGQAPV